MTNEELVQSYQKGDNQALEMLIEKNTRIIYMVINKFYIENTKSFDREDLKQEGLIGILTAANKYDMNNLKKAKFITYALYWIFQRINSFIQSRNTKNEVSLFTPIGEDKDTELCDTIKDDTNSYENIEDKLYFMQLHQELESVMNTYNTLQERDVLKLHYGWDTNKCMTLSNIGDILNIQPQQVRYTEDRALRKLRSSVWGRKMAIKYYNERFKDCNYSFSEKTKALDFQEMYL